MSAVSLIGNDGAILQDVGTGDRKELDGNVPSFSEFLARLEEQDIKQKEILVEREDSPAQNVAEDVFIRNDKGGCAFSVYHVDLDSVQEMSVDSNSRLYITDFSVYHVDLDSVQEQSKQEEISDSGKISDNNLSVISTIIFPVYGDKMVDIFTDFKSLNSWAEEADRDILSTQLALNREIKYAESTLFQDYEQIGVVAVDRKASKDDSGGVIRQNKESFLIIDEKSAEHQAICNNAVVDVDYADLSIQEGKGSDDTEATPHTTSKLFPVSQTISVADNSNSSDQSKCTVVFSVLDHANSTYDVLTNINPKEASEDISLRYSVYYGKASDSLANADDARNLYQRISCNGVNFRLPISDISDMGFMTVAFRSGSAAIIFRGEQQADANVSYLFGMIKDELTKLGFHKMKFNYVSYDKKHKPYGKFDQSKACNDSFINIMV